MTPLLMAVDGNSLLHRAHHAHAHSGQRDLAGRPTWGLRGMVAQIGVGRRAAHARTPCWSAFDHGDPLRRKGDYPELQGRPAEKTPELAEQIDGAPDLLAAAGFAVVRHEGWEADDCLASAAARARSQGWRCTVVTSDRDSFALIDETTSVLRVITGGIDASPVLTPAGCPMVCGMRRRAVPRLRRPARRLLRQPARRARHRRQDGRQAARRRSARVDDAYRAIDEGREHEVVAAVGPAATPRLADPAPATNVARNQRLMALRDDLELPGHDGMRVPMDLCGSTSVLARARHPPRPVAVGAHRLGARPAATRWAALAEQDDVRAPDPLVEAVPAPRGGRRRGRGPRGAAQPVLTASRTARSTAVRVAPGDQRPGPPG